jgi:hypothetical protein
VPPAHLLMLIWIFLPTVGIEVPILNARLQKISLFSVVLLSAILALAEGTRTWEQSKFDDLIKGTPQGVAIRSAGGLELAPSFSSLCTTPSTFIWAIAADQDGNLYAAAGSPARVYRITPDGKSTVIFEPQALQVQALVLDKSGAVYAATNPDGKVYKLERSTGSFSDKASDKKSAEGKSKAADSSWTSSVYFDPATKYIWDLTIDDSGNLYVATGDHGEIFSVSPKGEHSVFFQSDEAHIRVLALDRNGNLIAGSDGSGLVYRITPKGEAFVLYSAPRKEITALALDKQGNIYAAGVGEKHGGAPSFPSTTISIPAQVPSGAPSGAANPNPSQGTSTPPSITFSTSTSGITGGSEIYRIAPDGSPARIWTSHEDVVYALGFDQQGTLLAGTGNRGHVFAISSDDNYTDLLKASAGQVTAFAYAPNGLYAAASNLGKVFVLGAGATPEGSYVSDVFDAHIFSRWGRAELRSTGNVELFARSGNVDNPDRNWSAWQKVEVQKDGQVSVPAARFIQWKAVLHKGNPPPRVDSVTLNYLPKNVAPDFDDVTVQTGVRYQSLPKMPGSDSSGGAGMPHFDAPPPTIHDRDSIGVKWSVHDDNDDQMVYSVYYRGDGETRWLLLKDNLSDKFYSFDASLLPDGGYTIKVVASDAPSHSPGEALTSEKESTRFEVDTTPPRIENLSASYQGGGDNGQIHVSFRAVDGFSSIKRAEYSLDAGEWQYVEPVGQISDSKTENYDFHVPIPSDRAAQAPEPVVKNAEPGALEHVVVVRVYDRYENMSAAKTVIRSK